jgi:hypothetical protein
MVVRALVTAIVPATVNHQVADLAFLVDRVARIVLPLQAILVLHLGQGPPVAEQMMADLVLVGAAAPA